jgi:predicted RNA-binding protein with RPS1 domain
LGDIVFAKILEIDDEHKQMKLSIKDIDYKETGKKRKSLESPNGFKPLKDELPKWIDEILPSIKAQKN